MLLFECNSLLYIDIRVVSLTCLKVRAFISFEVSLLLCSILLAGILPFGAVFIELFFILTVATFLRVSIVYFHI